MLGSSPNHSNLYDISPLLFSAASVHVCGLYVEVVGTEHYGSNSLASSTRECRKRDGSYKSTRA
jgi:hypothetical protein